MADLIDRQAAIDKLQKGIDEQTNPLIRCGIRLAMNTINELPSADAVEVVRCRNCEHYFTSNLEMAKNHGAECTMMNRRTMPEDYCSYGQKM